MLRKIGYWNGLFILGSLYVRRRDIARSENAMPLTTQPLAMQILPLNSWSAMAKNRARPPCLMVDTNLPSSVMSLYLFKRFTLGTLTLSKESWNSKMNEKTEKNLICRICYLCIVYSVQTNFITHIFNLNCNKIIRHYSETNAQCGKIKNWLLLEKNFVKTAYIVI